MATRSMRYVAEAAPGTSATEDVHIEGLPTGGGTPAAGSVTNAMLAGGITKDKLAAGVVPPAYALPAATTAALGGVKKAAAVAAPAAGADAAALVTWATALTNALKAAGVLS